MDNRELNRILQIIQKSEGINLSKIARTAKVDRTYLSKLINLDITKPAGKNLLSKIGTAFPKYFQENNEYSQQKQQVDPDYLALLKDNDRFFKELLKEKVMTIDSNLNTVVGASDQISLLVESARSVILESLARLEKKPEHTLMDEAGSRVKRLMKEKKKQGTKNAVRT